jgi:hypothetical protein
VRRRSFWEDAAIPRGGVLVYNTGRSLESFLELQTQKGHCLAHPDVLISAVGTKVGVRVRVWVWGIYGSGALGHGSCDYRVREGQ